MSHAALENSSAVQPLALPVRVMPSQQKILEQLHYLTTFHQSMVILAGPEGAGKTTLLEVFLEQASDYANLAYLTGTGKLKVAEIRARLFQQIRTIGRIQPDASLSKTIRRALPDEPQHLIIVIDDAHHLPPIILDELQELVLHSRFTNGNKHRISVLVTGQTEWAARQPKELPSNANDKPEIVFIPELADQEALQFSKALLQGHEKGKALALDHFKIQTTLGTCLLYPGIIQAQLQNLVQPIPSTRYQIEDTEPEQRVKISHSNHKIKHNKSIKKTPIFLVFFALCFAIGVSAWLNQDLLTQFRERLPQNLTQAVTSNKAQENTEQPTQTVQTEVSESPQTAQTNITPGAYEAFLETLSQEAQAKAVDETFNFSFMAQKERLTNNSENQQPKSVTQDEINQAQTKSAESQAQLNPWESSYDNAYFIQARGERVVLQLTAITTEAALNRFLDKFKTKDLELRVYHTLKNERSWYVVTLGEFLSLDEARASITSLPHDIQALQPWAKPISWAQEDLSQVLKPST